MERERVQRETSIEAYKSLIEGGVLPRMQGLIWSFLYAKGPATRNEIARGIGSIPNDTSSRLRELISMGVVREVGEDTCRVSGKTVIVYDVTKQPYLATVVRAARRGQELYHVSGCEECLPLDHVETENSRVCWLDTAVERRLLGTGAPRECPLRNKDFIVRWR